MLSKTLAVHYHIPASCHEGGIRFPYYFGLWIDQLAKYFDKIMIFAYVTNDEKNYYELKAKNIELISLGRKPQTFLHSLKSIPKLVRIINDNAQSFDLICFRVPTFLAIYCVPFIGLRKVVMLFVGNMYRMIDTSNVATVKKLILKAYWGFDALILSIIARMSISFILSQEFSKEYRFLKNSHLTFTSTIEHKDVLEQKKISTNRQFTVTFLGRISPEKGLTYALNAVAMLKNQNIKLKIIGDISGNEYRKLKRQIKILKIQEKVEFTGLVTCMSEVYKHLDASDILLLPSLWDAQTRAIWEGMARGLPVIASRGIGAARQFDHLVELYLVDPASPDDIRDAILCLRDDREMYKRLSQASLRIARQKTIESSVVDFLRVIKKRSVNRCIL